MNFNLNLVIEGQTPAVLRGESAFTWGLASLGESIFCLAGHKAQLESSPPGLDLGHPWPRLFDLEGL